MTVACPPNEAVTSQCVAAIETSFTTVDWLIGATPVTIGAIYFVVSRVDRGVFRSRRDEKRQQEAELNAARADRGAVGVAALDSTHDKESPIREEETPITKAQMQTMDDAAQDLMWLGVSLAGIGGWIIYLVLSKFHLITDQYALWLATPEADVKTLILLISRSAAYAGVAGTAIWVSARFAQACFDQATRFRKRRHGAHVLNAVLQRYDAKIIEKGVTLADALAAFKDWNATIDSAFTRIRIPRWFRDQPAPDSAMTDQTLSRLVRLLERGERPGAAEPRP